MNHGTRLRGAWRLLGAAMSAVLLLSACTGSASTPTEVVITAPANGAEVKVGEGLKIQGRATGAGIARVDVIVDGAVYATIPGPEEGVADFQVPEVPWTPTSAGQHTISLSAYGVKPDEALLGRSETVIINAQAAALPPTPTVPAAATEPPPPPTAPPQSTVPAVQGDAAPTATPAQGAAAPAAPAADAGNEAPSVTVTNEFVNVRKGPAIGYDKLGELKQGEKAAVKGRSSDNSWYQISYKGGNGWVIADYVQANAAAKNVAVAAAPPLPAAAVAPAAPAAPVADSPDSPLVPLVPIAATAAPVAPAAPAGSTVGAKGVLRITSNPVAAGSTIYATWNIPNFASGEFDKGDGAGFKGPIAGAMTVDVPAIGGNRTLQLKWKDAAGAEQIDTIVVVVTGVAPPSAASMVGAKGILRVNANPVASGSTVFASWNIPNFREGSFDKGDGAGFKGPIAGAMTVDVPNVTGQRTVQLKWKDNNGNEQVDSIVLVLSGQSVAVPTPVPSGPCDASQPTWRGSNPQYPFCVGQDLEYVTAGIGSIQYYAPGTNQEIEVKWNVFGINGLYLKLEPNGDKCGPPGSGGINQALPGNSTFKFNVKDLAFGGYKLQLEVIRKDNTPVRYNEKYLCIISGAGAPPTAAPGATAAPAPGVPTAAP